MYSFDLLTHSLFLQECFCYGDTNLMHLLKVLILLLNKIPDLSVKKGKNLPYCFPKHETRAATMVSVNIAFSKTTYFFTLHRIKYTTNG